MDAATSNALGERAMPSLRRHGGGRGFERLSYSIRMKKAKCAPFGPDHSRPQFAEVPEKMTRISPWWSPDRHQDRRPFLIARGRIKAAIRAWFESEGFIEVEPGCLQVSPGNEAHLHALSTEIIGPDLSRTRRYLHTSPEFAMKKLLAAGETKIFAFSPCFRNREHGPLHATEFTMLEWYRAGVGYETVMDDAAHLLRLACETTGQRLISWRGAVAVPKGAADRLTVAEAFSRFAGIDLLEDTPRRHARPRRAGGTGAGSRDHSARRR